MLLHLLSLVAVVYGTPLVQLGGTAVAGTTFSGTNVEFFGAIPFAQPPLGALRLQPPVLTTTISASSFNATSFGPSCLQSKLPLSVSSEDCLTLNIYRPVGVSSGSNLPVMFWIYGGGFVAGSSSDYDGSGLVSRSVTRGSSVIVVSINYRLGPLGFPQSQEAGTKGAMNLGLQDQIAGLKWVQANIGLFGGDPSKVTVFGESAGAASIAIHLLGTTIKSLARAAIIESTTGLPVYGPEHNEAAWQSWVAAIPECASVAGTSDTFDCLRASTTPSSSFLASMISNNIATSAPIYQFLPVLDGVGGFMPLVPSLMIPQARIPVIIGNNLDEGTMFTPQSITSSSTIVDVITAYCTPSYAGSGILSSVVNRILTLYPNVPALGSPYGTGNNTFGLNPAFKQMASVIGDVIFQGPRRAFMDTQSLLGVKVFGYHFTDPYATIPLPGAAAGSLGVSHVAEVPYVFGSYMGYATASSFSPIVQDYWLSFATSLDPNDGKGTSRTTWAPYSFFNKVVMQLDSTNLTMIPDTFRGSQISFINSVPLVFHR